MLPTFYDAHKFTTHFLDKFLISVCHIDPFTRIGQQIIQLILSRIISQFSVGLLNNCRTICRRNILPYTIRYRQVILHIMFYRPNTSLRIRFKP